MMGWGGGAMGVGNKVSSLRQCVGPMMAVASGWNFKSIAMSSSCRCRSTAYASASRSRCATPANFAHLCSSVV